MGFCFSCCRRRRREPETDPLLPRQSSKDSLPPPHSRLEQAADVLAALSTGKLPSQSQINKALQEFLRSDFFTAQSKAAYGPLSKNGRKVVEDIREVVHAVLQVGMEKNDDDKLQDLIFQTTKIDADAVDVNISLKPNHAAVRDVQDLASVVPTEAEFSSDVDTVLRSLRQLSYLLLTSSTFRLLLSDVMVTTREILADVVASVGDIAVQVQTRAEAFEGAVRPGTDKAVEDMEILHRISDPVPDGTQNRWQQINREGTDRVKDKVCERVVQLIIQAQDDPAHVAALRSLISLLRKYAAKASLVTSMVSQASKSSLPHPEPSMYLQSSIFTSPPLVQALSDLQTLLERTASHHSLGPLIASCRDAVTAIPQTELLAEFLHDINAWVDRALKSPRYVTTRHGYRTLEELYDHARALFTDADPSNSDPQWARSMNAVLANLDDFTAAISSDRATHNLLAALDTLSTDVASVGRDAILPSHSAQRARLLRNELRNDIIAWVLPRLLRAIHALPMPRFEMTSETLDVVIDSVILTSPSTLSIPSASASFVPDHVRIQNWSELRLDVTEQAIEDHEHQNAGLSTVQSFTRLRVHVDGLRLQARDIAYYVEYKPYLGYVDEGLVSIDVGAENAVGEGLSVDIELEVSNGSDGHGLRNNDDNVFRVIDVQVDLPGLRFSIDKSRHWILNKALVQPLSGPIVRHFLCGMLAKQLRDGLETLSATLSEVHREAVTSAQEESRESRPSLMDYWLALIRHGGPLGTKVEESEEENEDENEEIVTHTNVTMKGVVHTTVTQPEPESSRPQTPTETAIAIGVGAQLLPGKGGPPDSHYDGNVSHIQVAREALDDVEESAEHLASQAKETVDSVVRRAVEVRHDMEVAGARMDVREQLEGKRKGWRSRAFDL